MNRKTILFVCTGNTCRSVIAEHLFKKMVSERIAAGDKGFENIEAASAGIAPIPGMNIAPGTVKALKEEGINPSGHKAKKLTPELLKEASAVIAMEKKHIEEINRVPGAKGKKIFHLDYFSGNKSAERDVPDPFGHSIEIYRECREKIRKNLEAVIDEISKGKI